tara:strand:- start:1679 stop:1912 length:234 start_codon:yes stop_codon:yes gene_type:complete
MIPIDREVLTTIAAVVCIAAVIFLFREMKKYKEDVDELKTFSSHVARHLSQPTKIGIDTAKEDTIEEQVLDAEKSEE